MNISAYRQSSNQRTVVEPPSAGPTQGQQRESYSGHKELTRPHLTSTRQPSEATGTPDNINNAQRPPTGECSNGIGGAIGSHAGQICRPFPSNCWMAPSSSRRRSNYPNWST